MALRARGETINFWELLVDMVMSLGPTKVNRQISERCREKMDTRSVLVTEKSNLLESLIQENFRLSLHRFCQKQIDFT